MLNYYLGLIILALGFISLPMKFDFDIISINQTLENDSFLTQALFFPEIVRCENNLERVENHLVAAIKIVLDHLPLSDIHRRCLNDLPSLKTVSLALPLNKETIGWHEAVELNFHTLNWTHNNEMDIVYVPVLDIEILNREKDRDKLEEKVKAEIKAEILRRKIVNSLKELAFLQRTKDVTLSKLLVSTELRTPKQLAQYQEKPEQEVSVLKQIGTYLNEETLPVAFEVDKEVKQLADALSGRTSRSILLVGSSGVGKTAIFYELVRRRQEFRLSSTPFWATSGSKLVAGMSGFGMWQKRCQEVWREASKQKAILFFGNLVELMQVGRSTHNNQGIASFFRPYLVRGDLTTIAECTPEQLPIIEKEDPHLLEAFQQIKILEPDLEKGRKILSNFASSGKHKTTPILPEALTMLDQLHRRYATYSAYPGRPLRFLKNLLSDLETEQILKEADICNAFSRETGLPLFLLDDSIKLDLAHTHEWFSKRVIGQAEAVNLVVDMLAMVKVRLTRPNKPIASFLFIGPTGVGKTEMAKSLAEFLFQDKNRLSRFDMSEYADSISVNRLIGGIFGSEGLLTAKVREQPFSVILFDEFEKAHPLFFDILLQVLGEGRLTDASGKLADFRNCVIIMTSNLGAESFQKGSMGFQTEDLTNAAKHFTNAVKDFLRPEFFNRIDRIIPFTALLPEIIKQITIRELTKLLDRDGIKFRNVNLSYDEKVTNYLAEKGYSPRYGARPLKRLIEKELLAPLSEKFNHYTLDTSLVAEVKLSTSNNLQISVKPNVDKHGRYISISITNNSLIGIVNSCNELRRNAYHLLHSPSVENIQSEIFQITKLEEKLKKSKNWKSPEELTKLSKLPILKTLVENCREIVDKVNALEEKLLLAFYGKEELLESTITKNLKLLSKNWETALFSIYGSIFHKTNFVTLAFYGESFPKVFALAQTYYNIAKAKNFEVEVFKAIIDKEQQKKEKDTEQKPKDLKPNENTEQTSSQQTPEKKLPFVPLKWEKITQENKFFQTPKEGIFTILLSIKGQHSYLYFASEIGTHIFKESSKLQICFVDSSNSSQSEYLPPENINRRAIMEKQAVRREYNSDKEIIEDMVLKQKIPFYGEILEHYIHELIDARLLKVAKAQVLQEKD